MLTEIPEAFGAEMIKFGALIRHWYAPPAPVKKVKLLGTDIEVQFEDDACNFYLTMPDVEMNDIATVFKLELGV